MLAPVSTVAAESWRYTLGGRTLCLDADDFRAQRDVVCRTIRQDLPLLMIGPRAFTWLEQTLTKDALAERLAISGYRKMALLTELQYEPGIYDIGGLVPPLVAELHLSTACEAHHPHPGLTIRAGAKNCISAALAVAERDSLKKYADKEPLHTALKDWQTLLPRLEAQGYRFNVEVILSDDSLYDNISLVRIGAMDDLTPLADLQNGDILVLQTFVVFEDVEAFVTTGKAVMRKLERTSDEPRGVRLTTQASPYSDTKIVMHHAYVYLGLGAELVFEKQGSPYKQPFQIVPQTETLRHYQSLSSSPISIVVFRKSAEFQTLDAPIMHVANLPSSLHSCSGAPR